MSTGEGGGHPGVLRKTASFLIHKAGPLAAMRRWNRTGVCILLYHHFPPARAALFERQCTLLRKHHSPVSMADVAAWLDGGPPLPPNPAVITVDDGYRNFYTVAYPILRRYGIPATMFLTTGFLDRADWLWVDKLRYAFQQTRLRAVELPLAGETVRLALDNDEAKERAFVTVRQAAKRMRNRERLLLLRELPSLLGQTLPDHPPEELQPLLWDEVREMGRHGMEFGAHTKTHPILSSIDDERELEDEILGSKSRIEEEMDQPVAHFAYPNGMESDIPSSGPGITRRARFRTALRAYGGLNFRADADPHLLHRRTADPVTPLDRFERTVSGWPS